ncbi:RraA family protein [Gilvimarinus sp. F26214L]|uniref:RraA family protein n=1 Tax=Gilvimarinus sp. DZF01 TaxID=3461371 RepID=UPI004045BB62
MAERPRSAEMNNGPGFRIKTSVDRPSAKVVEAYREFDTPDISDILNRMYAMCCDIHNLVSRDAIVGPAVTVKVFPGDNLMVHKALDLIRPGDIIVVDASGTQNNAVIGDLIASKAKHRGAQGIIIDGLIRDLPEVRKVGLPVFARGVSPIGPLHRGPGEINYPISCGGIVVKPGDIIAADESGIVVVRQDFAETVLSQLQSKKAALESYVAAVKQGQFSNAWVDEVLRESRCDIHE